jgi:hypothetical protein
MLSPAAKRSHGQGSGPGQERKIVGFARTYECWTSASSLVICCFNSALDIKRYGLADISAGSILWLQSGCTTGVNTSTDRAWVVAG